MGNKIPATNVAILNAVRSIQSLEYQNRIPEATAENISSIYESLLNIVPLRNAFANALVEQIMEQRIETVFLKIRSEYLRETQCATAAQKRRFL